MAGFSGSTGVPIKQMQDAISQSTAITSGSLTAVFSGITNVEVARWVKCGKIVTLVCKFTVAESTDLLNTDVMFRGAPGRSSAYNTNVRFTASPIDTSISWKKNMRLAVYDNGDVTNWYTPGSSFPAGQYEFTVTYIAD